MSDASVDGVKVSVPNGRGRCLLLTYMDPAIGGIGGNGGIGPQRIQSDAQVMLAFTARFSSRLLGPS
ncbi:hypothetical protein [Burkholderia cepacia]|uniref:hypothetical protein n=1 Tax=Burkholderia cepacia TaxID=292 RepID=UPI0011BE2026|nr:hypothetical protein [Burkholderia cepacia]